MSSPITLLIIDDDEDDRQFFMEVVEQVNPSVISTFRHTGQEALNALHINNIALPDAIFLDLNMPRLNGFSMPGTTEEKRKNFRHSGYHLYYPQTKRGYRRSQKIRGCSIIL